MRITCPGRYGDLLWACAVIRAISEGLDAPVDLRISGEFNPIAGLLCQQPYIKTVVASANWSMTTQDQHAWCPPQAAEGDVHVGYRGWPDQPLPQYVYQQTREIYPDLPMASLDLQRPWITVPPYAHKRATWTCGFSEYHFELKYGLWELLTHQPQGLGPLSLCTGPRWKQEAKHGGCGWEDAAQWIAASRVFLGDCSALHVLAVALGVPALIMEPMEARWNPIFWPLGMDGPQVRCVKGNDGRPTCDARHVADDLKEALSHV